MTFRHDAFRTSRSKLFLRDFLQQRLTLRSRHTLPRNCPLNMQFNFPLELLRYRRKLLTNLTTVLRMRSCFARIFWPTVSAISSRYVLNLRSNAMSTRGESVAPQLILKLIKADHGNREKDRGKERERNQERQRKGKSRGKRSSWRSCTNVSATRTGGEAGRKTRNENHWPTTQPVRHE